MKSREKNTGRVRERRKVMEYKSFYDSPVGRIVMVSDGNSLSYLGFEEQRFVNPLLPSLAERQDLPVISMAKEWLDIYFSGKDPGFSVPLSLTGTSFQKTVWEILLTIPFGTTVSYSDVASLAARRLSKDRMSCRAAGSAVGHNPVSIIVPCHRVVGKNGSLTGYGGGLARKIMLLETEGIDTSVFSMPQHFHAFNQIARDLMH